MFARVCLVLQRLLLSAWVGGAVLFVVTSVAEQQFDGFSAAMKNQLALIRFPKYYAFGFGALILASLGGVVRLVSGSGDRITKVVTGLLLCATVLMAIDYMFIYEPLAEMMRDAERPRDAAFRRYHDASKYINAAGILLALLAAVLVSRHADATRTPASGQDQA